DGKPVSTAQQLRNELRGKRIGQPVTLQVFRQTKTIEVKVATGESGAPVLARSNRGPATEAERNGLGVTIHVLTRDLASQFGVQPADGVIVVGVEKGTPAERKGLRPGDIITSINQQSVANPKQFRDALKKADLKKGVIVSFISGNAARFEV